MTSREQELRFIEETKELVYAFIKSNMPNSDLLELSEIASLKNDLLDERINLINDGSDLGLAEITGFSSSKVQRRLTDKERFLAAFPINGEVIFNRIQDKRERNKEAGKSLGGHKSQIIYGNKDDKLFLNFFCKTYEEEMSFLYNITTYFNANLSTLLELFPYSEEEIMTELFKYDNKGVLEEVLLNNQYNQELSKGLIVSYYRSLLNTKDNNYLKTMISSNERDGINAK